MKEQLAQRSLYLRVFFILATILLLWKAFSLQVLDRSFQRQAEATVMDKEVLYPSRGLIYDRNGNLLTYNKPVYDIWVVYNLVDPDMDTELFCRLLHMDKKEFKQRLNKDWSSVRYSKRKPFIFLSTVSPEDYARFQEHLYEFPGFQAQRRSVRAHPNSVAAHVLGYIREVSEKDIEKSKGIYQSGDYIGASGLEKYYEQELRGVKGARYLLKDNLGNVIGSYQDGRLDSAAVLGFNIISSLDLDLQTYAEKLMEGKTGAVVAIEPETGEVLALVSKPDYDPNLMTISRGRGHIVKSLSSDPKQPFFNRAIMAEYPPGSVFKTLVGLVALQEDVIDPDAYHHCPGYYSYNNFTWGCRSHPPVYNLANAIQYSCNSYFFQTFRSIVDKGGFNHPEIGLDTFAAYMHRFGLGMPLGIDLPGEQGGNIPDSRYYNKLYPKERGGWRSPTIISLGIGQGENLLTTLQMANIAAAIGNRGYYYRPHLAKAFVKEGKMTPISVGELHQTGVDTIWFPYVIQGMRDVVTAGTGRRAFLPDIEVAGKTGTVQNPHGPDHATFIAFAPVDKPRIALAVYVEQGGHSTFAAAIAGLLIEKYLKGEISPQRKYMENYVLNTKL